MPPPRALLGAVFLLLPGIAPAQDILDTLGRFPTAASIAEGQSMRFTILAGGVAGRFPQGSSYFANFEIVGTTGFSTNDYRFVGPSDCRLTGLSTAAPGCNVEINFLVDLELEQGENVTFRWTGIDRVTNGVRSVHETFSLPRATSFTVTQTHPTRLSADKSTVAEGETVRFTIVSSIHSALLSSVPPGQGGQAFFAVYEITGLDQAEYQFVGGSDCRLSSGSGFFDCELTIRPLVDFDVGNEVMTFRWTGIRRVDNAGVSHTHETFSRPLTEAVTVTHHPPPVFIEGCVNVADDFTSFGCNPRDSWSRSVSVREGQVLLFRLNFLGARRVPGIYFYTATGDDITSGDYSGLGGVRVRPRPFFSEIPGRVEALGFTGAFRVTNDNLNEGEETLLITVTEREGQDLDIDDTPLTVTIAASDPTTVSIARKAGESGAVNEGGTATFTVTLAGGATTADLMVPFTITDVVVPNTINGPSTAAPTSPLTISAGESSGEIVVTTVRDGILESNGRFTITLDAPDNDGAGGPSGGGEGDISVDAGKNEVAVAIVDTATISVFPLSAGVPVTTAPHVNEPGTAQFGVFYQGGNPAVGADDVNVTVTYTIGGTVAAADYTDAGSGSFTFATRADVAARTISISVVDDTVAEFDETLTLTLATATIGVGQANISPTAASASVTIPRNDGVNFSLRFVQRVSQGGMTVRNRIAEINEGQRVGIDVCVSGESFEDVDALVTFRVAGSAIRGANGDYTLGRWHLVADLIASDLDGYLIRSYEADEGEVCEAIIIIGAGGGDQPLIVRDDNDNEGPETITATITRIDAQGLRTSFDPAPVTLTIRRSDPITISADLCRAPPPASCGVTVTTPGIPETGTAEARRFHIVLPIDEAGAGLGADVTVNYTISGDDVTAADYTDANAGAFTLAAGTAANSRHFPITIADDTLAEGPEFLTVTITSLSSAGDVSLKAGTAVHRVLVPANDGLRYDVAPVAAEVAEGATARFTMRALGDSAVAAIGQFGVPYVIRGTHELAAEVARQSPPLTCAGPGIANAGICTGTVDIAIPADNIVENDETLRVHIAGSATNFAAVTVTDATGLAVSIAAPADAVAEGETAEFPLSFNLADGVTLAEEVVIQYLFFGAAVTNGSDQITIAAGQDAGAISIAISEDDLNEAASPLTVDLSSATGAAIADGAGEAEATITASDPGTVTIARHSNTNASVGEAAAASFTVTLAGGVRTGALTVPLTFAGLDAAEYDFTAPAMGDYDNDAATDDTAPPASATGVTLVFAVDGTETATDSQTVTVNLIGDSLNEAAETLTLTGAAAGATGLRIVGGGISYTDGGNTANVGVTDDDPVTYSIADATAVTEVDAGGTNPTMSFTVSLSGASAGDVTIPYTLTGSATGGGADYTDPSPLSVTIAAGDTTADIEITIAADDLNEAAETIIVTLAAETEDGFSKGDAAGAVTLSTTTGDNVGTGTINDDDAVTLTLTGGGDVNEGGIALITVELSSDAADQGMITVNYTIGSTAAATDNDAEVADYTDTPGGSITIDSASRHLRSVTRIVPSQGTSVTTMVLQGGFSIGLNNDDLNEGDETFEVRVAAGGTSLPGGVTVSGSPRTFTIKDAAADAIAVTIAKHSPSGNSVDEEASVTFRVTLSSTGNAVRTAALVVPFTVTGLDNAEFEITAPTGIAATATGGDLTFPAPNPSATPPVTAAHNDHLDITINLQADNLNEATETLTVTGAAPGATGLRTAGAVRYTSGGNTAGISVTDNAADAIEVTISQQTPASNAAAGEAATATFRVALSGGLRPGNVFVPFAFTGTLGNAEYTITSALDSDNDPSTAAVVPAATATGGVVSFGTGGTPSATDHVDITVNLHGDALNEATETLIITGAAAGATGLRVASGGTIRYDDASATSNTATLSVSDDDDITVTLARTAPAGSGNVAEGATVVFTVSFADSDGDPATSAAAINIPWSTSLTTQNQDSGQAANSASNPDLAAAGVTPTGAAALAGTLAVTAGQSGGTISITVANDGLAEGLETFRLALGTPAPQTGAGVAALSGGAQSVDVGIIANVAIAHLVTASAGAAVTEGGNAVFTIRLPAVTGAHARTAPLTVAYTLTGSATGGAATSATRDYTTPSGALSLTFPVSGPGSTEHTVTIATVNDTVNEAAETIILTLGAITAQSSFDTIGGAGVSGAVQVTVNDNDAVTYSIADANPVTEVDAGGANPTMRFTVSLSGASAGAVTIPYDLAGTASPGFPGSGGDYTAPGGSVTIAAGDTSGNIDISVLADSLNEAAETIIITLRDESHLSFSKAAAAGAVTRSELSGADTASGTINDNDPVTVTLAAAAADINEGETAGFGVTLDRASSAPVMIGYTVTAGGATAPPFADPGNIGRPAGTGASSGSITIAQGMTTGTIQVVSTASATNTGSGTLTVTLGTHSAAGGISGAGSQSVTVTFREFDRNFSAAVDTGSGKTVDRDLSADGVQVDEGDTVYFTVTLAGTAPTASATVQWTPNGDTAATAATLTFTTGNWQTAQEVSFTAAQDTINEAAESLGLTLSNASGGGGSGTGIATPGAGVTVRGNDDITYAIAAAASGTETDSADPAVTVTVTVTLSGATESAWTNINVPFTVAGSSTAGSSDYSISASPLTFTGADVSEDITVTITADQLHEENETVLINLGTAATTGSGGGVLTQGTAQSTVTINDDDDLRVIINGPSPANVDESDDAEFTIALSGGLSQNPVSVTLAFSGSATGGADASTNPDYITPSTTFTIPAGRADATLTIPLRHDGVDEGATHETLTVAISAATGRGVTASGSATVNVVNVNTVRALTVTRAPGESGDVTEGGTVNFRVTLTGDNFTSAAAVNWAVTHGDAESADFSGAASGAVNFTAADAANAFRTFSVRTAQDTVNEAAETFSVNVTAPNTLTDVGAAASVTIAESDPLSYAISADRRVAEGDGAVTFTVRLSGASGSEFDSISVPFTVDNASTATVTADYTITASPLVFNDLSGASPALSADIVLTIVADTMREAAETVTINLGAATTSGAGGGSLTAGDASATLTIANDDALMVSIARSDGDGFAEGAAGAAGTAVFTVTVAGGTSTAAVSVPFTIGGEGITAGDYTVSPASPLRIAAGVVSAGITVAAVADGLSEAAETLTVTLGAPSGGGEPPAPVLGTATAAAVIAADAVGVMVSLARLGAGMVDEGDAVRFAVMLSGANAAVVSVRWRAEMQRQTNVDAAGERRANDAGAPEFRNGDADGLTASGTVAVAARATTAEFVVVPRHDGRKEDAETIMVTISAPTVGAGGGPVSLAAATATAVVRENEATLRDEGILAEQMTAVAAALGRTTALVTTSVIRNRLLQRRNDRSALSVAGQDVETAPDVARSEAAGPWAANPAARAVVADRGMRGAGVESADWRRTSFALPLFFQRPSWHAGRAALWGAGATAGEDGEMTLSQGALSYDADATAFHLGADWERVDGKVVGFSVGRTRGKARAAQTIGGIDIRNLSESSIVSVHPYMLRRLNETTHGWLALGYGAGEVEVVETQFSASVRRARSDQTLTMAAFGAVWQRPSDNICAPWPGALPAPRAYDFALRIDGMLTRNALDGATFDDGSFLPAVAADTTRLGLETEIGRAWECELNALRVFATAGVRNDFRDARKTTSAAADLGGGLHWRRGSIFALRVQGAKQALGDGDEHTWDAEMHWTGRSEGFRIIPFVQVASGSETPDWQGGLRLHKRRLTLRLGLGLGEHGADYKQLMQGEIRF